MNGEPWIMLISRSHPKVSVWNVLYRTEATQGISYKWLPHCRKTHRQIGFNIAYVKYAILILAPNPLNKYAIGYNDFNNFIIHNTVVNSCKT
jgi:hypothetical protein